MAATVRGGTTARRFRARLVLKVIVAFLYLIGAALLLPGFAFIIPKEVDEIHSGTKLVPVPIFASRHRYAGGVDFLLTGMGLVAIAAWLEWARLFFGNARHRSAFAEAEAEASARRPSAADDGAFPWVAPRPCAGAGAGAAGAGGARGAGAAGQASAGSSSSAASSARDPLRLQGAEACALEAPSGDFAEEELEDSPHERGPFWERLAGQSCQVIGSMAILLGCVAFLPEYSLSAPPARFLGMQAPKLGSRLFEVGSGFYFAGAMFAMRGALRGVAAARQAGRTAAPAWVAAVGFLLFLTASVVLFANGTLPVTEAVEAGELRIFGACCLLSGALCLTALTGLEVAAGCAALHRHSRTRQRSLF